MLLFQTILEMVAVEPFVVPVVEELVVFVASSEVDIDRDLLSFDEHPFDHLYDMPGNVG